MNLTTFRQQWLTLTKQLVAPAPGDSDDNLALAEALMALVDEASVCTDHALPLATLATRLALPRATVASFCFLAMAEIDDELADLLSRHLVHTSRGDVPLALLANWFYPTPAHGWRDLNSEQVLAKLGLIACNGHNEMSPTLRSVRCTDLGLGLFIGMEPELPDGVTLVHCKQNHHPLAANPASIVFVRNGDAQELVEVAARFGIARTLLIDAEQVDVASAAVKCLGRLALLANLHDAVPLVVNCGAWQSHWREVDSCLVRLTQGTLLFAGAEPPRLAAKTIVEPEVRAPVDSAAWFAALPPDIAEQFTSRFAFSPGQVDSILRQAAALSQSGVPQRSDIERAIVSLLDRKFGSIARRLENAASWSELVLPTEEEFRLIEIARRVQCRTQVLDQWGFGAKFGRGVGIAALLSGPPGTGKTMAATVLTNELGLPIYQVDTPALVSKYIGETEKNLARVFDAAEGGNAIILFDEADSLFGKRTEVKSSNDRNANLETNYLLQRLEAFTGICLLTTNHEDSIDAAFRRRFATHVRLPRPDASAREQMWRKMIPQRAPLGDNFDAAALAERFELTGGYIKNAVLRAACHASAEKRPLMQQYFIYSAQIELEAMGRLVLTRRM